jgi:hypothetical protein
LFQRGLLAFLAIASLGAQAKFNGEDRGRPLLPSQVNAKWQQECSGCHMAFAPGLLPAASWKKVMQGLDKHFGSDASLSPQDTAEITGFLVKNPSNRWSSSAAPLRVTESQWFKSKHLSGEIAASVWQRASVKSASNCLACHSGADKGVFDEHGVKIPQ